MATTPRAYTWREAELINSSADETGATFHFYDTNAEMIYPNSGLKYKYGSVPEGHWEDLELSEEGTLEDTAYIFLKSDHPATGSLYMIALDRGTRDILYLFRYDYERDVSELVESATLTLQGDNPIAQISANIKNVKDSLFTAESSLFTPTAKILLGVGYGKSAINTLATGYMDEVEWKHGAKTVSISGRNAVGYFLNSQTFDADKSFSGTAVAILTQIFDFFGIAHYEIDDSDSKKIEFDVSANDTGLKAVQIVSDLMTDLLTDKIWDIEELYDGTVIAGLAPFRGERNPKGVYVFNGRNDVFTRKINRSIDGAFSHVRCTGTDKSGHDLTPALQEVETWRYWKPAVHRTYHAPKVDGLASSEELLRYCKILAEQLQKNGKTTNYSTTLKPQLIVGDVATIQGEEGEENETLGIITEIKHSFGEKGYMTDFTAASGGIIQTIGNNTYTKKKSVGGTDRTRRLSDFTGGTETPTRESNNPLEPQPTIDEFTYAHFDGRGKIELPFKVNDIVDGVTLEVAFLLDRAIRNMAVFGNETGQSYAHLATGAASGWTTSSGAAMTTFTAPFDRELKFILNDNGENFIEYGSVRTRVGYYTPATGYEWKMYLGGNEGQTNFAGKIKSLKLKSGTQTIVNMYPAVAKRADGTTERQGLYDNISNQWYSCEGLTVDKPVLVRRGYAHFAGTGHIALELPIVNVYKATVWFTSDEILSGQAVFGNSIGNAYANLTKGQAAGAWITSEGEEMTSFMIETSDTELAFVCNHNGKNWMRYEGTDHEVSDYTPTTAPVDCVLWLGGCANQSNFAGDISQFTYTDIRDNTIVANIQPTEQYSADGRLMKSGLYDIINDVWYNCTGLTLHD